MNSCENLKLHLTRLALKKYKYIMLITGILQELARRVVPQGGTLVFSYIRRLGSFFWFKILNFNIFGAFKKKSIFLGMKILWIFFRGHHKIGLYFGVISMHFRVFS